VAKYSSADIGYLLLGQYDLTNISSKLEDGVEAPVEDITPFGVNQAVVARPTNFKKYTLSGHEGWYDDAAGSINAAMIGMSATEEVLMFAPTGNTVGMRAVSAGGAVRAGYKRGFEVGQYHKASFDLSISGVRDDAYIVTPLAVKTGTGNNNSTYVDLGVGNEGSLGLSMYICITSFTQSTSTGLVITAQDAATVPTWVTQVASPNITAAGGYKVVSTDMPVSRYLSVAWAWGGTVGSAAATFTVAIGVNR
jgi:hypothetical protein